MTQRFIAHPCLEGFEVIDASTGRPVMPPRETRSSANGIAQQLNMAAENGVKALARALRAA